MAQHSTAQHSTPPITVAAAVSLRTVGRYVRNNQLGLVARWCTLRRATPWRDRGRRRYAQQSRVKQPWLACFVEGGGGAFNRFDERGRRSKENCEIDAPPETRINNPNRSVARVLLAGCQFPLLLLEPGAENRRAGHAWRVAHLCFQPSLLVADCAVRSGPLGAKPSASDAACAARRQSGGFRTAQRNSYTTAARQPTARWTVSST